MTPRQKMLVQTTFAQAAPVVPEPAPLAPVLPEWMAAEPWMPELVERFARALAAYPDGEGQRAGTRLVRSLEAVARADQEPDEEE